MSGHGGYSSSTGHGHAKPEQVVVHDKPKDAPIASQIAPPSAAQIAIAENSAPPAHAPTVGHGHRPSGHHKVAIQHAAHVEQRHVDRRGPMPGDNAYSENPAKVEMAAAATLKAQKAPNAGSGTTTTAKANFPVPGMSGH